MVDKEEELVEGAEKLVVPLYSYWMLGYLLSLRGAKKLVEAHPLEKLLPADEFVPIMFNTHPRLAAATQPSMIEVLEVQPCHGNSIVMAAKIIGGELSIGLI